MGLQNGEILIDDDNYSSYLGQVVVAGEPKAKGLIPRDYNQFPPGGYSGIPTMRSVQMPLIPRSEWSARIKEMEEAESRLSDLRFSTNGGKGFNSLDQNGQGFCWAYSSTAAVMYARAVQNQPFKRLSAHGVACEIKNHRDEGGWGAHSQEFIASRGVPDVEHWPEKSMSRSHNNPETWANAKLYRIAEGWAEVDDPVYDRDLTFDQVITCLLCRIPVVSDFNWWGHSVCAVDPVEVEPGSFGLRIQNSWGDSWSDRGLGVLRGSKAIPDGASAVRSVVAS